MESLPVSSEASESKQSEVEKLMQLLFLSSVQMDTVDDQQLIGCVAQLSVLSLQELAEAPARIQAEEESLRHQTEKLAVENYPIFLSNASTSREVHREFESISTSNDLLLDLVSQASSTAQAISRGTDNYGLNFRRNARLAQNHTQLLEFLELPQLMETCVQNGYYEDALNILAHVKRICKKHGQSVPVVRIVAAQTEQISGQLFFQLCKQLREPITLPVCLKIVVHLRQLGAFSEQELRLNFLQARGACLLQQLSTALSRPVTGSTVDTLGHNYPGLNVSLGGSRRVEQESYILAMRRIEVTRVHLFDIITQYRAVFADEEGFSRSLGLSGSKLGGSNGGELSSHTLLSNISPLSLEDLPGFTLPLGSVVDGLVCPKPSSPFHAWLVTQVSAFLDGLSGDLERILRLPSLSVAEVTDQLAFIMTNKDTTPGSSTTDDALSYAVTPESVTSVFQRIHSLLTQSLYFGRSFARIGCDFRAHLATLFSKAILKYFEALLSNALTEFYATLEQWPWELEGCENFEAQNDPTTDASGSVQPPVTLLRYPPLAIFCNRLLTAMNGLRMCCPVGLKQGVMVALLRNLRLACEAIVNVYHARTDQHLVGACRTKAANLAAACVHSAVPHLLTCTLQHLFGGEVEGHLWQLHLPSSTGLPTTHSLIETLGRDVCRPLTDTWHKLSSEVMPSSADAVTNTGEKRRSVVNSEVPSSTVSQECLNPGVLPLSDALQHTEPLEEEVTPTTSLPSEESKPNTEVGDRVIVEVLEFVDEKSSDHIPSKSPLAEQSVFADKPAETPCIQTSSLSSAMDTESIEAPKGEGSRTPHSVPEKCFPPEEDCEKPVQLAACPPEENPVAPAVHKDSGNGETDNVRLHCSQSFTPSTAPLPDMDLPSACSASPSTKSVAPFVADADSNNNSDVFTGVKSVSPCPTQAPSSGLASLSSDAAAGLTFPSPRSPERSPSEVSLPPTTMKMFSGVPSEQESLSETKKITPSASPLVVRDSGMLSVDVSETDGDSSTPGSRFFPNSVNPRSPALGSPDASLPAQEFEALSDAPPTIPSIDTGLLSPSKPSIRGTTDPTDETDKLLQPETPTQSLYSDHQMGCVHSEVMASAPCADTDNDLLRKELNTLPEDRLCAPGDVLHAAHKEEDVLENEVIARDVTETAVLPSAVSDACEMRAHYSTGQPSKYTLVDQSAGDSKPLVDSFSPLAVDIGVAGNDLNPPDGERGLLKVLEPSSLQGSVKLPDVNMVSLGRDDLNHPPAVDKTTGADGLDESKNCTTEVGDETYRTPETPSLRRPAESPGSIEVKSECGDWGRLPTSNNSQGPTRSNEKSHLIPASAGDERLPTFPYEPKAEANRLYQRSELSPGVTTVPLHETIDSLLTPPGPEPESSGERVEVSPSQMKPPITLSLPVRVQHDPVSVGLSHVPHGLPKEDPLVSPIVISENTMDPAADVPTNPLHTVQETCVSPPGQESLGIATPISPSIPAMEASSASMLLEEDDWEGWDESPPDEGTSLGKKKGADSTQIREQESVDQIAEPVERPKCEHIPHALPTDDTVFCPPPSSEDEPSDAVDKSGWDFDF
ncbi:conserved oligomeric Golgi complex component [Sparganum proliferum]